jgi:large subunit ribosomal protein L13
MASYTASTSFVTPKEVTRSWWLIDGATAGSLGRIAARIALILRGKHKASFTPHINCGDHIVIINADKIKITGKKLEQKIFYWHTGYAGGIKEKTWDEIKKGKKPQDLIKKAIERMLPKESPLANEQYNKLLHVYLGATHPHQGQNPKVIEILRQKTKKDAK